MPNVNDEQRLMAAANLASRSLADFCIAMDHKWIPAWFHEKICKSLEEVEQGKITRLIICLPPRSGKSLIASVYFPAWFLGRQPDAQVITTSYSAELAQDFGGKAKDVVSNDAYQLVFPKAKLRKDTAAKDKWAFTKGGSYTAVGVGGPITGRGADLLLLDDVFKNREEADSKLIRDKIFSWYTSTAYTRLMPGGRIVMLMCMVGDTNVLMGDGSEKSLRDIRSGDVIATFDNGKIATSVVRNWKNQGPDSVYEIRMTSGTIVKANKRHPFLVERDGKKVWIRLQHLKIGDKVLRAIGVNGVGSSVNTKDAKNLPNAEDFAMSTIKRLNGQMENAHPPIVPKSTESIVSVTDMESEQPNTMLCSQPKVEDAPSATKFLEKTSALTGEENCASTTTMKLEESEDCSATTATSPLVTEKQKLSYLPLLNTYEIGLDCIADIVESGTEDVFDIEVERTENFIANGLVSHNTRWSNDDLIGRLLKDPTEPWTVLEYPAVAIQDDEKRKKGEALWPEMYPLHVLERTRAALGPLDWASLYQQKPMLSEFQEFKPEYIRTYDPTQKGFDNGQYNIYTGVDLAISKKDSADFTAIVTFARDRFTGDAYLLDVIRERLDPLETIEAIFSVHARFRPSKIGIETTAYQQSIIYFMDAEMKRRKIFPFIVPITHSTNKEARIRRIQPYYRTGQVYHSKVESEGQRALQNEMFEFPKGGHDDAIDAAATCFELFDSTEAKPQARRMTLSSFDPYAANAEYGGGNGMGSEPPSAWTI